MTRARGLLGLSAVGLVLCLVLAAPAWAQYGFATGNRQIVRTDVQVEPQSFEFSTPCGGLVEDSLCVLTPSGVIFNAVDILFIMDVTNSMADELAVVKSAAIDIMNDIGGLMIDAQYGVGAFRDYPGDYDYCGYSNTYGLGGDYPWVMAQDITGNPAEVQAAVDGLVAFGGWDTPEPYARALYECLFFNFRPGTKKIVLMFGDAPVHDCDFLDPVSLGQDPGRDAILETGDDLDYETVVSKVAAAGITVLSIDSSNQSPGGNGAWENFEYMADQTGGTHYLLAQASDIPEAIVELISEEVVLIDWLTLDVNPEVPFSDWFSFLPTGYAEVGGPDTLCFTFQIAPVNVPVGDVNFDIVVVGDGSDLVYVPVMIHITGASAVEETSWGKLRRKFWNNPGR